MEKQAEYITDALEMIGMTEPKQIIQEVSGFVPVFEALLEKYDDHITALVFGRRWQYCRMRDGVCRASLETIANDLKISSATVMRHTEKLVEDGYLIDLTPDLRNVPHSYADAGKIVMKSQLTASVSQRNTSISQGNATVSESQLIKGIIKQDKKEQPLSIENAIATGQPVTDDMLDNGDDEKLRNFERCLGFGILPWGSNTIWTKFSKWVIAHSGFEADYARWREGEGKYKAFSNKKIRENPAAFIDTGYPEYEASKMYQKDSDGRHAL